MVIPACAAWFFLEASWLWRRLVTKRPVAQPATELASAA
jgi:hypothetical protein